MPGRRANQFYYCVVESARLEGQLRIVDEAWVGMADKGAALVKDCTFPPRGARLRAAGPSMALSGACWRRSGPSLHPDFGARVPGASGKRAGLVFGNRSRLQQMSRGAATTGKVMVDPNSPASTRVRAAEATRTWGPEAIQRDDIQARVAELQRAAEVSRHETVR